MIKGEKFQRVKISEEEYKEFVKVEKTVKSAKILKRIQAFKLMYLDWKYNKIAKFLSVTNDTITDWIKIFKAEGIHGLLKLHYKGRKPMLSKKQIEILRKESKKKAFKTAKQAKKYIEENFGVSYHLHHVQLLLKKRFAYPLKKPGEYQEKRQTQKNKKELLSK